MGINSMGSSSTLHTSQSDQKETKNTPFKRGRSKVFYASDSNEIPKFSIHPISRCNVSSNNDVPDVRLERRVQPAVWRSTLDTCKETSEGSSSGDEAASPAGSRIRSPVGSLRSSLGGSIRGSQDSGYSDSGESNSGGAAETDAVESPPKVKHISRVFFSGGPDRTSLYTDTIITTPPVSPAPTSFSPESACLIQRQRSCSTQVELPDSCSISRSSPTSVCNTDEPQYQIMENKSLLDISSSSYDELASRKTGAIRKSSYVTSHKRGPRRSTSADKLSDETKHRRPCTLKARRRWSAIEVKSPIQSIKETPFYLFSETTDNVKCSSLGNLQETPANSTADANQSQTKIIPRKANIKRLRIHPTAIAAEMKNGSLAKWLSEVRYLAETECMNTLQSKSLASEAPHGSISAVDAVRSTQRRAHAVSAEFARLCRRLEKRQTERLPALSRSLVAHINAFLREPSGPSASTAGPKSALSRQIEVVRQICHRLMEITTVKENHSLADNSSQRFSNVDDNDNITIKHSLSEPLAESLLNESLSNVKSNIEDNTLWIVDSLNDEKLITDTPNVRDWSTKELAQVITALGHAYTKLVDILLSVEIKEVVRCLETDAAPPDAVRSALRQVTSLGVDGGHICRLIARLGGVRSILALCLEPKRRPLRVAALRALATVCCVSDGITYLEKTGGIEVIVEILCDEEGPEDERSEAAAVLAQITSPWVEDHHSIVSLHRHIDPVVAALTSLVQRTESAEIFLLGSAALANLTFLDSERCCASLLGAGTAATLLGAARDAPGLSVFTKDQIATVIASMCSHTAGAEAVTLGGGTDALIGLLHTRPPTPPARLAEVTAAERVQQKTAIALSRLCCNPAVSSAVLQQGGGSRLVLLCKDETERNHSDAVLVACLAALRKIASSCGHEKLRNIDAAELVEPRLLDTFLAYSSRRESYV